jgi:hypothetical protein
MEKLQAQSIKPAQLSRQKISASPRQIYNAQAACLRPQPLSQATCRHRSYTLKAPEESSIVCTNAAETVRTIIQVHTRLIVWTILAAFVWPKECDSKPAR